MSVLHWTQEQTAGAAAEALRDDAAIFRECLRKSDRPELKAAVEKWELFEKHLLKRFGKPKDITKQVQSITNLKQKPNETVDAFADRVNYTLNKITEKTLEKCRNDESKLEGYREMRLKFESMIFLSGLRRDIVFGTNLMLTDDMPMDDIRETTRKAETASNTQKGQVNALMSEISKEREKTKQMMHKVEEVLKNKPQGMQNSVAAARTTTSKPKQKLKMADRNPMLCFKCHQWGKHMARECKLTQGEIDALTPMSRDDKPTGPIVDAQFPNC